MGILSVLCLSLRAWLRNLRRSCWRVTTGNPKICFFSVTVGRCLLTSTTFRTPSIRHSRKWALTNTEEGRGLVWHSTRHTFNSLMRGKIDTGKLMRIVGHSNESTNLRYVHALPEDLVAVRTVQESIFAGVKKPDPQAQVQVSSQGEGCIEKEVPR